MHYGHNMQGQQGPKNTAPSKNFKKYVKYFLLQKHMMPLHKQPFPNFPLCILSKKLIYRYDRPTNVRTKFLHDTFFIQIGRAHV